ncbi:hypothetical protein AALO_G00290260 [Alosa alosa]|uniref:Uncharacterized protein n=1 Tax=Alosa alosa TaxID=278164 RepID=A0AAV6FGX4_9TELE|nr:hypothetical protein AALO_G00290260 [Alosa alosa]
MPTDPQMLPFVVHRDHVESHGLRSRQEDGQNPDQYDLDGGPFGHADTLYAVPGCHGSIPAKENPDSRTGVASEVINLCYYEPLQPPPPSSPLPYFRF